MRWVPRQEGPRRLSEGQLLAVAAGPQQTLVGFERLGSAGLLLLASCDVPGWLSLYVSAAAVAADAERLQSQDPAPEAGVVLDAVFGDSESVQRLPPGVSWANQDDPPVPILYARLRTELAAPMEVMVSLTSLQLAP
jgi:hypothetical protein